MVLLVCGLSQNREKQILDGTIDARINHDLTVQIQTFLKTVGSKFRHQPTTKNDRHILYQYYYYLYYHNRQTTHHCFAKQLDLLFHITTIVLT